MQTTVSTRVGLLIVAAVVLSIVLFFVLALSKQYKQQTTTAYPTIPPLTQVRDIPSNIDNTILNATAVDTCMEPVMQERPTTEVTPPAVRSERNLQQYHYDIRRSHIFLNEWLAKYENGLKTCYNTQLKTVYAEATAEYTQKSWQ